MAFFKPKKNPRTASEVTKGWLELVLAQYESKTCPGSTVEVASFEVNPGCAKGENFQSDVMRILAEAQVTPARGTPSPAHYSFIVKFLPGNEIEQATSIQFGAPKRELLALSKVLPALNAFQKERGDDKYRINAPEHVYGVCAVGEYVLVMQDFRESGFLVEDKRRGLSLLQLKTAIRNMAHLHAVSYAFSRTHDFLSEYPDFKENKIIPGMMGVMGRVITEGLQDALEGREDEFPGLLEALASNKDTVTSTLTDAITMSGKTVVCLCHGDFWTNNIMFKCDKEGAVEDFAMIDWGNVAWRSPVLDLQYLIYTSTQQDLRKDNLKEVQTLYYETFTSAAADLGAALPHWGFEDFLAEWKRTAVAGIIFAVFVNLITLSKSGRKFHRGTLTTGFISWLRTMLGKMIMLMPESWMVKFSYPHLKAEWKPCFDDLASMNNPEMTTRVMNLLMEAFRTSVMDP